MATAFRNFHTAVAGLTAVDEYTNFRWPAECFPIPSAGRHRGLASRRVGGDINLLDHAIGLPWFTHIRLPVVLERA